MWFLSFAGGRYVNAGSQAGSIPFRVNYAKKTVFFQFGFSLVV